MNDVLFSCHALLMSVIMGVQVMIYKVNMDSHDLFVGAVLKWLALLPPPRQ
jgi:hypothetical protein